MREVRGAECSRMNVRWCGLRSALKQQTEECQGLYVTKISDMPLHPTKNIARWVSKQMKCIGCY